MILLLFSFIAAIWGFVEVTNKEYPYIPGEYIVTYHADTAEEDAIAHWGLVAARDGVEIMYKYNVGVHKGFAAKLSDVAVGLLQIDPIVMAIEVNGIVHANQATPTCRGSTTTARSWGLSRVSHLGPTPGDGLKGIYYYDIDDFDGKGTTIYIIDTGIRDDHIDFIRLDGTKRVTWAPETWAPGGPVDQNGHGTHCAGTAAGNTFGLAAQADLVAVKVLDAGGSGTWAGVIAGVNWVAANGKAHKSVGSMSLGGGGPQLGLNQAIQACLNNNIPIVVAAGNSNANACSYSPSGAPGVISVGSMEISGFDPNEVDAKSSFSNWGTCVHIWAPGRDITSAWHTSTTAVNTISGTSMACPHVAGAVAEFLSSHEGATPADVYKYIVTDFSQKGIIRGNLGTGSPNLLLYNRCGVGA